MTPEGNRLVTRVVRLRNKTTGKPAGRIKFSYGSAHNAPIDEFPPVGMEEGLKKEKPALPKPRDVGEYWWQRY